MEVSEAHANVHGHLIVTSFMHIIALCGIIGLDIDLDAKLGELLRNVLRRSEIFCEIGGYLQNKLPLLFLFLDPDTIAALFLAYPCQQNLGLPQTLIVRVWFCSLASQKP